MPLLCGVERGCNLTRWTVYCCQSNQFTTRAVVGVANDKLGDIIIIIIMIIKRGTQSTRNATSSYRYINYLIVKFIRIHFA